MPSRWLDRHDAPGIAEPRDRCPRPQRLDRTMDRQTAIAVAAGSKGLAYRLQHGSARVMAAGHAAMEAVSLVGRVHRDGRNSCGPAGALDAGMAALDFG